MESEAGVELSSHELIYSWILFSQMPALSDIGKPWNQDETSWHALHDLVATTKHTFSAEI